MGGNVSAIQRVAKEQYNRLKPEGKDGIPLSEILKVEMPRDFDFNIKHIGTLWELDK